MAWDINRVIIVGRLTRDVDFRYTPSQTAIAKFGIAVGGRPNQDGTPSVSFFDVVVWGKAAETCNTYLSKGKQVAIDGRLQQQTWQTQDGSKRSRVEIVAERVEFLGGNPTNQKNQTSGQNSFHQAGSASQNHYSNTPTIDNNLSGDAGFNDDDLGIGGDEDVPF